MAVHPGCVRSNRKRSAFINSERLRRAHGLDHQRLRRRQPQPNHPRERPIGETPGREPRPSTSTRRLASPSRSMHAIHTTRGRPAPSVQLVPYPEAGVTGTNLSAITITGADTPKATITATAVCREPWLPNIVKCSGNGTARIILAVTDDASPQLTRYRRVIVSVRPAAAQ
jgi:hypothetical protein